MAAANEEVAVRPSSPLIAILHRRLRDPGIVPSFERRRRGDSTSGLVGTRWTLRRPRRDAVGVGGEGVGNSNVNVGGNVGGVRAGKGADEGEMRKCDNGIPDRGHIDLRMEQNEMFADEQCRRCEELLSNLLQADGMGDPPPPPVAADRWKERSESIRSLLDEGLAACPGHGGLLRLEVLYRARIKQSTRALTGGPMNFNVTDPLASREAMGKGAHVIPGTIAPVAAARGKGRSKGAEGRARAAMSDVLAERSFLLGSNGDADVSGGVYVDYPPIQSDINLKARAGEAVVGIDTGGGKGLEKGSWQGNGESYSSDIDSRDGSHSRDRGRQKRRKYKKRKKRGKSKRRSRKSRRSHKDGRRRKRKGNSISRSLSISSQSQSRSRSPRSLSSYSAASSSCRGGRRCGEDVRREKGRRSRIQTYKDKGRSYDIRHLDDKDDERGNDFCHGENERGCDDCLGGKDGTVK